SAPHVAPVAPAEPLALDCSQYRSPAVLTTPSRSSALTATAGGSGNVCTPVFAAITSGLLMNTSVKVLAPAGRHTSSWKVSVFGPAATLHDVSVPPPAGTA